MYMTAFRVLPSMMSHVYSRTASITSLILLLALFSQAQQIRTLSEQELRDMMVGASIQASRSSNTAEMIKQIMAALAEGKTFKIVSMEDVPDTWNVLVPSGVGGGGAWDYVRERTKKQNLPVVKDPMVLAINALSAHLSKKFQGIVRSEGGGATVEALLVASALDVPVVDACMTGRAVPEMEQSTTFIHGLLGSPAAVVTRWGDTILIDKAIDDYRLEDLTRAIAVGSGGGVALASNVMSGSEIKRAVIPGAFSQAILWGRTVREAREHGQDPISALVRVSGGYKLFQGKVIKSDIKGDRGFNWGDIEIQGTGPYDGHTYKVFLKNENIVAWLDGKPDAMSPDFISNLDPATGDALSGHGLGAYPMNAEVAMVGIPASPLWRIPKGIEVIGPRYFGFDFDYQPIEEIQKNRPKFDGK
jgi:uncharacterized protein